MSSFCLGSSICISHGRRNHVPTVDLHGLASKLLYAKRVARIKGDEAPRHRPLMLAMPAALPEAHGIDALKEGARNPTFDV